MLTAPFALDWCLGIVTHCTPHRGSVHLTASMFEQGCLKFSLMHGTHYGHRCHCCPTASPESKGNCCTPAVPPLTRCHNKKILNLHCVCHTSPSPTPPPRQLLCVEVGWTSVTELHSPVHSEKLLIVSLCIKDSISSRSLRTLCSRDRFTSTLESNRNTQRIATVESAYPPGPCQMIKLPHDKMPPTNSIHHTFLHINADTNF